MVDNKEPEHFHNEEGEEKEETLATPGVIDKYKQAGKIADAALLLVISKIKPGVNVIEICDQGDRFINEELKKCFSKKKFEKGIAFPTCLSINEICGHYSPISSEASEKDLAASILKEGDVVKIDLGTHIDGYMALVAHTVVCQADNSKPVEGRKADVILAAYNALQASLRLLKPGNKNTEISETIKEVSESYQTNAVEGVLSHELKKHLIDGNKVILNKESFDQKVDESEFQVNDVFAFDVIVSTGEGKPRESEFRTTVYKRALEKQYTLKTKHGRTFMHEIIEKFPALCFSLRSFEDEITAKLGVTECQKHDLLVSYPVLTEKQGELVA